MPDTETHTAADIYNMFAHGNVYSTNFGPCVVGAVKQNLDGQNMIIRRGSILVSRQGAASNDLKIELEDGQYIHLTFESTVNELGMISNISYNYGLYNADGTAYTYGVYNYGDAPSPSNHSIWDKPTAQATAWRSEPYAASFFTQLVTNQDESQSVLVGLMITPEAYVEGKWYPSTPPIQVIDERKCDWILMPFMFDSPDQTGDYIDGLYNFFEGAFTPENEEYDDGDVGPTGGGGGTYESRNDWMDWPSLPSISATSTGFVALYAPTAAQLHSIANWLWSENFFTNVIKNYADPFQNILGLFISPITPPSATSVFKVGNVSSGIDANKVGNQYMQITCGRVSINPYYNSFADYDNYRSYKIFLPYYGIVDLSTDDFMGGTVEVRYNIDFFTGSATIAVGTTRSSGIQHILHTYSTNIFAQIPFSGVNMSSFYTQSIASAASLISSGISGNIATMSQGVMGLLNAHPTYGGSRGMGATGGLMGIQYPYLIECRSIRDMPAGYNANEGIPLNRVKKPSELSGYTEYEQIHVKIASATDDEALEIEKILKEGVIL